MTDQTAPGAIPRPVLTALGLSQTDASAPDRGTDSVTAALTEALAALAMPGTGPAPDGLAGMLRHLLALAEADDRRLRTEVHIARFQSQHIAQAQARRTEAPRLFGLEQALNLDLARALDALPARKRKALFDAGAYLATNPDVAQAGADPITHYLRSGAAEGRAPGGRDPAALRAEGPRNVVALLDWKWAGFVSEFAPELRRDALALLGRERPTVSVIIPSWNRAATLGPAVASALLQSYAPTQVIVADDGSTDGTAAMLAARFAEPLAEGRLRHLPLPHGGVSAARNAGLEAATGEIIAYLDSDNRWDPDHLLMACAALLTRPEAPMAYTALARHNLADGWSDLLFEPFDRAALEAANTIDLNAVVHPRKALERTGGFDTALTRLVDWDLILRLTEQAQALAVPVITGHYLLAGGGADNITLTEDSEPNMAKIRAKLAARGGGQAT